MYQRIQLSCECGRPPARVRELGLTSDRQLVIHWRCGQCKKHMFVVKSLADYWRECPSTPVQRFADYQIATRSTYHADDERFLRQVGIRPDDGA